MDGKAKGQSKGVATTLSLEEFWTWLQRHPNCILRISTPEAVIYDDDDLHWTFSMEDDETYLVQAYRGKRIAGEIFIRIADVSYVQLEPPESDEEHVFELISETESDRVVSYQVALVHGLEDDQEQGGSPSAGWRH